MTPLERETYAKSALSPMSTSINDEGTLSETDTGAGQAREVRNKYLNRIGVQEGNSSDTEPLLQ
jgi:hypothetical protein